MQKIYIYIYIYISLKKTYKKIVLCLGEVIHIFIDFLATPMITVIPFSWGMEGVFEYNYKKIYQDLCPRLGMVD